MSVDTVAIVEETRLARQGWLDLCRRFNDDPKWLDDPHHGQDFREHLERLRRMFSHHRGSVSTSLFDRYRPGQCANGLPSRPATFALKAQPVPTATPAVAPLSTPATSAPVAPPPTATPIPVPDASNAADSTDSTGAPSPPWLDLFVMVHPDAVAALTPLQFKTLVILVRMMTKMGDGYIDPVRVCRMVGLGLKTEKVNVDGKTTTRPVLDKNGNTTVATTITLRRWLSKGGPLYPFVRLRGTETGSRAYLTWAKDDSERWRLDHQPLPLFCRLPRRADDDNDKGKTLFVKVPFNWAWEDPTTADGEQWSSRALSDDALWAGALCIREAKNSEGFRRGVSYLADDYNIGARTMKQRLAAAEDAGLIRVQDRAGNRHSAYRMPQMRVTSTRSTSSRARTPHDGNADLPEIEFAVEPPF